MFCVFFTFFTGKKTLGPSRRRHGIFFHLRDGSSRRGEETTSYPFGYFQKYGWKSPKMDGENKGKPLLEWMIWGGYPPYFRKHPFIFGHL